MTYANAHDIMLYRVLDQYMLYDSIYMKYKTGETHL